MTYHQKSLHDAHPARPIGYHVDAAAENLFFTVYRCWMAGYATGDVACWDIAWEALCREMPVENAKPLFGAFHHFVRTLRQSAVDEVAWRPAACRALCRDECLILAMADAAQRDARPQLATAAAHLLRGAEAEGAVVALTALAQAFARLGLFITPVSPGAFDMMIRMGTEPGAR
ncbi:hypothetical protein [Labrys wisconsinensis]|uniref:Uncharacterized protein n=1 Tax=Labrys wisconsinensis TaxID=425677 RepID=A0ABU0JAG8_9HYPH|nr:hypothetical protein [Labrys wisconsinensis]MDQ0471264.1 hypothetical protein [Labrys wisconsinensis]